MELVRHQKWQALALGVPKVLRYGHCSEVQVGLCLALETTRCVANGASVNPRNPEQIGVGLKNAGNCLLPSAQIPQLCSYTFGHHLPRQKTTACNEAQDCFGQSHRTSTTQELLQGSILQSLLPVEVNVGNLQIGHVKSGNVFAFLRETYPFTTLKNH